MGAGRIAASLLLGAACAASANGQSADPTAFASSADVVVQVAALEREMKPEQGFAWKPLVKAGQTVAAIEIWRKPGKPAVHPGQAEYATVLKGHGTLVSGGMLADPVVRNPTLTEGSRIEGGTTRRLGPGDVILVPAGVPHWFGIDGQELVLLGTKIDAAPAP